MKSEIRDGMRVDWDAPIKMDYGVDTTNTLHFAPDAGPFLLLPVIAPK